MDPTSLEPLREVATIAAGNAATALSKLNGHEITVALPSVKLVKIEKILTEVGDVAAVSSVTLVRITGDIQGLLLFTFDPHDAQAMTTGIIGQQTGGAFDDKDQAVLREMVNIVSGAALSAIATFLSMDISQSVPAHATDMLGATLDPFIAEFGSAFETAFILQELFTIPVNGTSLKCIAIIDPPSTTKILQKMTEKLSPAHATDN